MLCKGDFGEYCQRITGLIGSFTHVGLLLRDIQIISPDALPQQGTRMAMNDPTIELLSPAKINLFLAVTGRRPDGYHELWTLMTCIDLCDHIALRFTGKDIRLSCSAQDIPTDDANLAFRAAQIYREAYQTKRGDLPFPGLSIQLTKTIPAGAGLGGGSSNAATILKALNRQAKEPFDSTQMAALALEIGADVPFFLDGQPAIATGIGEVLSPWSGLPPYPVVVVFPGRGLATAEMYKGLNLGLTNCQKKLKGFVLKHGIFDAAEHLCNDLETVAFLRCPDIPAIKNELLQLGALGALMSGSGSSVFGVFMSAEEARNASQRIKKRADWQVFQASVIA